MLSFFKNLLGKTPEGIKNNALDSYSNGLKLHQLKLEPEIVGMLGLEESAHFFALFWVVRRAYYGSNINKVEIFSAYSEVLPFLVMPKEKALELLIEYIISKENLSTDNSIELTKELSSVIEESFEADLANKEKCALVFACERSKPYWLTNLLPVDLQNKFETKFSISANFEPWDLPAVLRA